MAITVITLVQDLKESQTSIFVDFCDFLQNLLKTCFIGGLLVNLPDENTLRMNCQISFRLRVK